MTVPVPPELEAEVEQALATINVGVADHDAEPGEALSVTLTDDGARMVALGWMHMGDSASGRLAASLGFEFVWHVVVAPGQLIDVAPFVHEFAIVALIRAVHVPLGRAYLVRFVRRLDETQWHMDVASRQVRTLGDVT